MVERIREVLVRVHVDTNKATYGRTIEPDDEEGIPTFLRRTADELRRLADAWEIDGFDALPMEDP